MHNMNEKASPLRNLRIIAVNNGNASGFNIYLDFSGNIEFLTYHRHNCYLYDLLKDSIRVDDLRRMKHIKADTCTHITRKSQRYRSGVIEHIVSHLVNMIDRHLIERNESINESCVTEVVSFIPVHNPVKC